MFAKRVATLNRTLNLLRISDNYLKENLIRSPLKSWQRCVHSSNKHEIDFLFSKYKLTKIVNGGKTYGQKSALHYFNTIHEFNFENERDSTADGLHRLLNVGKSDANWVVKNYPSLVEVAINTFEKRILYLSENFNLTADDLMACPWVLYLPMNFISERLNPFDTRAIKRDHLILLLLPLKTYESVSKKIKNNKFRENISNDFNKKMNLFTKSLDIIGEEFCDLIHENCFLFHYEFERLETIMKLVLSSGVKPETILSDIKIFTHNIELMKERMNECLKHNMSIKTWMLRSAEHEFRVCLRRHIENKKVLKDYNNNKEYMANQLKCDKSIVESMTKRYPRIVQINAKNLCQKLSLLFDKGFTTYHIIDTPKILFHSIDTILKRNRELETIGIRPNSLKVFTLSEKDYQKLLEQLKEINGNISQ